MKKHKYNLRGLLSEKICSFHKSSTGNREPETFSTEYSYDNFDRIVKVSSPAGVCSYTYDKKGRILTTNYTNSHENKSPDSASSASCQMLDKSFVVSNSYDSAGRLLSKKFRANSCNSWTTLCSYEYDKLDRRVKAEYLGVKWSYGYDEFNQLISASSSDGYVYGYGFDKIGNRMFASLMENGAEKFKNDFEYNSLNQIASQGFEYDRYGNMIKAKDSEYSYDLHNRLIEVKKPNVSVKYYYDALGQRIKSEETVSASTRTTTFLMSGMVEQARMDVSPLPLGEGKGEDGKAMFHTLGLDLASSLTATGCVGGVLASTTYSSPYTLNHAPYTLSYCFDGNVIAATDSSGTMTAKLAYSPFGELLSSSDANLPFTFSTKAVDASGLSYYGFRFYSPEVGRWLSRDPIGERGGRNIHSYVKNAYVNKVDMLGLFLLEL